MTDDPEVTDPRQPHRRRDVDVVAELDRWLDNSNDRTTAIERRVVLRARHEIVALRAFKARVFADIRDEVLEEAAQRCDRLATDYTIPVSADKWSDGCRGCAGRIRALKGTAP